MKSFNFLLLLVLLSNFICLEACDITPQKQEEKRLNYDTIVTDICRCGERVITQNLKMEKMKKDKQLEKLFVAFDVLDKEVRKMKSCVQEVETKNAFEFDLNENVRDRIRNRCPKIYKILVQ